MKSIELATAMIALTLMIGHTPGCGGNDGGTGAGGATSTSTSATSTNSSSGTGASGGAGGTGGGSNNPAPPAPGALIDRMGRPVENTALNNAFEKNLAKKEMAKDLWNTSEAQNWTSHQTEVAKSLAIFDAFNGVCGDQYLAGPTAAPGRYDALAAVLTNDRLWINSDQAVCTTYLAVETNTSGDCGGRAPYYDVIDTSYSLLITGKTTGTGDGVNKPSDVDGATFPYLAAPNP